MRLARISTTDGPREVVQRGENWHGIADIFARPPVETGESWPVVGSELLAPVEPRVILGMAHNGAPGDRELPPQAFMKSARTAVGPGDAIILRAGTGVVVGEGELAVVIGARCRDARAEDVPGLILGYTIGNDVTAVDQVPLDEKMTQSKNGDGFTPLGPWIETDLDPADVTIAVSVNGEPRVESTTARLAYNVVEQVVYLSSWLELGPGDIILTGSPQTATPILPGDVVEIELTGLGVLANPVH
ncbi:fumarylacetoacetate hydrolase family protein [Mycetocola spongiae]|uniref:fumarylacetoacetate hydrolase family protein n=1 Tax=Mycetocola spongiae TaxID=2859226 RepID=UPI001CF1513B|nr:fumarylacetoacetate hydrolase family protein [Mycetocola spongiae]UCR88108.1 fumarylacetoacetate hydrolase family protein [Mycetocola spongiae]